MKKRTNKKWWVWIFVLVAVCILGWLVWRWYYTRISPFTPQASGWNCPSDKLIKGNAQSGIYHVPGGRYYNETKPERCFASESNAEKAGYRRSKK